MPLEQTLAFYMNEKPSAALVRDWFGYPRIRVRTADGISTAEFVHIAEDDPAESLAFFQALRDCTQQAVNILAQRVSAQD